MKVEDVMTSDVVTVSPDTSLRDAAALLTEHRISGLPVVDEARVVVGGLVGIVTRADLIRAFARSDEEVGRRRFEEDA